MPSSVCWGLAIVGLIIIYEIIYLKDGGEM